MTYCMAIPSGLWAFMGVLGVLCGLVLAGVAIVAVAERRGAAKERMRKVQVRGAVRVGPRLFDQPGQAANDPDHSQLGK